MSGDTLSDLLRAVRLRGAVFFYVEAADPWVVETPRSSEIIPTILPGVEHLMPFHGVARGTCWATLVGEEPIRLKEGDIALFPQGDRHVMSSAHTNPTALRTQCEREWRDHGADRWRRERSDQDRVRFFGL
jgi:hypothetical protein